MDVPIADDFETDDFSSTWEATGGTGLERAAAGDGPLTSFGMTDSPGGAPAPDSVHITALTTGVSVPAGTGSCMLGAMRFRRADAGSSFFYQVLSDGSPVFTNSGQANTAGSKMVAFSTTPMNGLAGHSVKLRFGYTAGPAPTAESGLWLDDIKLTCYAPLSTPPGYAFLQGTSMAAPHVTGAAGLLFSLEPSASVTEVREALLAGAEPIPSLAGKTATGGRLDIPSAMDALETGPVDDLPPEAPLLTATDPVSPANDGSPKILGSAEDESTIDIYNGEACESPAVASGTAAELESPGLAVDVPAGTTRQFTATATDAAENTSPCSEPIEYTNSTKIIVVDPGEVIVDPLREPLPGTIPAAIVPLPVLPSCKVPKLAGKTLGQAKAALSAAGCRIGKVSKPKARRGQKPPVLVVKSTAPGAGSTASGAVVALTLGPKPKRHHH